MSALEQEVARLREKVQVLAGDRGSDQKAAVRRAEFEALTAKIVALSKKSLSLAETVTEAAAAAQQLQDEADVLAQQVQNNIRHLADINAALLDETLARASDTAASALEDATTLVELARVQDEDKATAYRQTMALRSEAAGMRATLVQQVEAVRDDAEARISTVEDAFAAAGAAMSQRIETVEAALPDKADASALSSLSATVAEQDDAITAQSQIITGVQAALGTKAAAEAVDTLTARVSETEDGLQSVAGAVTSIQAVLPGKAEVTALDSLSATVVQQGQSVTAQGQTITGIQASLDGKVEASAYNAFVVSANNNFNAHSTWITGVEVKSNYGSAYGRLVFDTVSGPAGTDSRFRLVVAKYGQANGASGWSEAGLFIDSGADGAIVLQAAKTTIMNPNGTVAALFDAGTGKVAKAYIPQITSEMITTDVLIANSAQIGNLVISGDKIQSGAVSNRIASAADGALVIFPASSWVDLMSITMNSNGDDGFIVAAEATVLQSSNGSDVLNYRVLLDGNEYYLFDGPRDRRQLMNEVLFLSSGTHTMTLQAKSAAAGWYYRYGSIKAIRIAK